MRDCLVCGAVASVPSTKGPATCPACKRAKYLLVKRRYQQSAKGKATARTREERPDVREKRRMAAISPQGRKNKAKYEATAPGKKTRRLASKKYRASERGKQAAAAQHIATKDAPQRMAQREMVNARYARTEKMKAKKRRDYARRKSAVVRERPFTAEMWLEMLSRHKHLCYYCKKRRTLTLDHITPVSRGGLHVEENIVPACLSCNARKNAKTILIC